MNATKIPVQYPTEKVTIVPKTAEQVARERIMFRTQDIADHYRIVTLVNEPQTIYVKQVERMVQEEFMDNDDYSIEQTGLTAAAFQSKFKRAFNE
jgi:hypothetical protein